MEITLLQQIIEDSVSGRRQYHDADYTLFNPQKIAVSERDTEIGLQRALFRMEVRAGIIGINSAFHTRELFAKMIYELKESNLPLSSITNVDEFNSAMDQDRICSLTSYSGLIHSLRKTSSFQFA